MLKKFFLKSCVFSFLFSSIISINDASALNKNLEKTHTVKASSARDYKNMMHDKKHNYKAHYKKHNKERKNHIYDNSLNDNHHQYNSKHKCESFNKYHKYFAGFGFGLGFYSGSERVIDFNSINQNLFTPNANIDFLASQYDVKFDYSLNPSISFGYWAQNHLSVGIDFDYFSLRDKQRNSDGYSDGYIENQIASATAVAQFFLNVSDKISPYLQFGVGVGRAMLKGAIANKDVAALDEDYTLYFNGLDKNVALVKIGLGVAKEFGSSAIGIGYQFVKTTKIDNSDGGVTAKFQNGLLQDQANFGFSDLAKQNHAVNVFVKSSF